MHVYKLKNVRDTTRNTNRCGNKCTAPPNKFRGPSDLIGVVARLCEQYVEVVHQYTRHMISIWVSAEPLHNKKETLIACPKSSEPCKAWLQKCKLSAALRFSRAPSCRWHQGKASPCRMAWDLASEQSMFWTIVCVWVYIYTYYDICVYIVFSIIYWQLVAWRQMTNARIPYSSPCPGRLTRQQRFCLPWLQAPVLMPHSKCYSWSCSVCR